MSVSIDMTGALHKMMVLKNLTQASKKQASLWAADTVKELKLRALGMKKSGSGTSQLARNIGMQVVANGDSWDIRIGTGTWVGAPNDVVYANIQDKGGIIRAKGKWLTIPFPGVKGRASNFDCFPMKTKRGNMILFEAKQMKKYTQLKPLFLLRKQVIIPATGWFTTTLNIRKPALSVMMSPSAIYNAAESMVK
jgi:hypothetical protein